MRTAKAVKTQRRPEIPAHQVVSVLEVCRCLLVASVPRRPLVLPHLLARDHQRAQAL